MEWDFCPVILPKQLIDGTFASGSSCAAASMDNGSSAGPTDAEETEWYYLRAY
jgi:hypothetical protein